MSQSSKTFTYNGKEMKDEPMLADECQNCLMHDSTLKEKDAQITQLKQAILVQYSEDCEDSDIEKRWLEMLSSEFAEISKSKKALKHQLDTQ